jgi:hypothetical protein
VPLTLRWLFKSSGTDQMPAELIKARQRKICSKMHKLINSVWNKEQLPKEWKESIIVLVYKMGDKTDCSNYSGVSLCQLCRKFYSKPAVKFNSIC